MILAELKTLQDPTTVEEQVDNLISKGLTISNIEFAKDFLNKVSYYRFVKAYSLGLKPKNGNYIEGVSFEQLSDIYEFNKLLRQYLFPLAENIEIRLRCSLSNYFSEKYGNMGYEDSSNFNNPYHHADFLSELASELIRSKKNPFVTNFQNNYMDGKLPFYAIIELFSFGMLSKFYRNLKNEDRKEISKNYFNVIYTYFDSWIESLAAVRNICAHYGRLYNLKLTKQPILYKEYSSIANYRIFAVILAMKHLISDEKLWGQFVTKLRVITNTYGKSINFDYIGFPLNWEDMLEKS